MDSSVEASRRITPAATTTTGTNALLQGVSSRVKPEVTSGVSSGVISGVTSRATSSGIPEASPAAGGFPDESLSSVKSLPASSGVIRTLPGSPEKEEKTASASGALTAKKDTKQASAAKERKAKEPEVESRVNSTAAAAAAPIVAVATPVAPKVLSNLSSKEDSLSAPGAGTQTAEPGFNQSVAFTSEAATATSKGTAAPPVAAPSVVAPSLASAAAERIAIAMRANAVSSATHANADSTPAAQPQPRLEATPQSAISSSAPPDCAALSAAGLTNDPASASKASQHVLPSHPAQARETVARGSSPSAASSASASSASAHLSSVQAVAAPATVPAITNAASATQSATQLASQSAAVSTQPSFAQSSPAPAHAQLQSNPIPDPPRMVDSGQLRVTPNNSELKISVQLPELGKVEVRAITAHDVTTAHLTAFSHDALPALSAGRNGLEQALKSRDVVLGSFDSHPQGHSGGQQRQQSFQTFAPSPGAASIRATIVPTAEVIGSGQLPDYSSISIRV